MNKSMMIMFLMWMVVKSEELICPALFIIINLNEPSEEQVDYGNYFIKNNTQLGQYFYISKSRYNDLKLKFPCSMIITMVTDDYKQEFTLKMEEWYTHECQRLEVEECFTPQQIRGFINYKSLLSLF